MPTSVFVIGVSRLNGGLIAATAEYEGIPLVTEEKRLTRRARQQGIEVWSWERLLKRMHELARDAGA